MIPVEGLDWSQSSELDRFTAHDPVRRGCDQLQCTQFRWNGV